MDTFKSKLDYLKYKKKLEYNYHQMKYSKSNERSLSFKKDFSENSNITTRKPSIRSKNSKHPSLIAYMDASEISDSCIILDPSGSSTRKTFNKNVQTQTALDDYNHESLKNSQISLRVEINSLKIEMNDLKKIIKDIQLNSSTNCIKTNNKIIQLLQIEDRYSFEQSRSTKKYR